MNPANPTTTWQEELDARLRRGLRLFSHIAIVIFLVFWAMDLLIFPDVAFEFLGLRVMCAAGYLVALFAIERARTTRHLRIIGPCLVWWVSFAICVMQTMTGYETSLYWVGLVLVVTASATVFAWPWQDALVAGAGMAAMLIMVALLNPELDKHAALNNVGFLLGAVGIGLAANIRSNQLARAEFDSRKELADAVDKLRRLDELKSRFFANVSHELRTPLTLILAPVETLLAGGGSGDKTELRVIRNNAARLTRMIDELLDLSRLDAGGLRLNVALVDMVSMVRSLVENARPAAAQKQIELVVSDDASSEFDVHGDAHRLEIILTNLLTNALKHTPGGGHVALRVRGGGGSDVVVDVEDDGPGISEADLPHVFDRFFQASSGTERRRTAGAGIGLALAKELAELHSGNLTVTSVVGEGTTFSLTLQEGNQHFRPDVLERRKTFRPQSGGRREWDRLAESVDLEVLDEATAPPTPAAVHGRVLVVEDQNELRAFIAQLLSGTYEVIEAVDGQDGIEKMRSEGPDLVLSDIMMPRKTGTELCHEIKSDPVLRTTPVILLTARVGSEATLEAYAHGADDFVAKPFHPQVLLARVRAQLQLRAMGLQMLAQEKLASIGTLAAGVAHEVRNPINAIMSAAEVLTSTDDAKVSEKLLSVIADSARRIDAIVGALDNHAKPAEHGGNTPCDVRQGLDSTFALLGHRLEGVTVHREYESARAARIPAGPANQVFLNLLDNAVRSGASNVWARVREESGNIVVRIADDGPGIPDHVAHRVFDAFFTTREPGSGTGLGLHLSRAIVQEHGGRIELLRRDGGGAEFVVELPGA